MIEKILSAYYLDKEKLDIMSFGIGLINKTWRIKDSRHDYILQQINHTVFKNPDAIAFNVRTISEYLKDKYPEYLFITPIKTADSRDILHIKNHGYFRLCMYVSHSHAIDTVQKPEQAFEAARKFTLAIGEVGWHKFKTMLEYKSEWYGKNILHIGRFQPSSKLCNTWGHIFKELRLKDRSWTCQSCGTTHDRDCNAANNIKNFGLRIKPSTVNVSH